LKIIWFHKTRLTSSPLVGVPVPSKEHVGAGICVLGQSIIASFYGFSIGF